MKKLLIASSCLVFLCLISCTTDSIDEKNLMNDELNTGSQTPTPSPVIDTGHGDKDKDKDKG